MGYQRSFFEDEVRDGFFVPGIMKGCWAYAKNLYDQLMEICDDSQIRCVAAWGTMLGAVRYGGFVPWDDDIDVEMLRSDYEVLLKKSESGALGKFQVLDDLHREVPEPDLVRRFSDRKGGSWFSEEERLELNCGFPFPSVLDIFLYDYVPRDGQKKTEYRKNISILASIIGYLEDHRQTIADQGMTLYDFTIEKADQELIERLEWIQDHFGFQFDQKRSLIRQVMEKVEFYSSIYPIEQCDERVMAANWCVHKERIFDNRLYEDTIEVPFERGTMRIPIGYDHILRVFYPRYMYPKTTWDNHGYPWFDRAEKRAWEEAGEKFLRYEYDRERIESDRAKNMGKTSLKQSMEASLELLSQAHEFIQSAYLVPEKIPSVLDMLMQCQELAIHMGEQTEIRAVDSKKTVSILERYCDCVYELYQKIIEQEPSGTVAKQTGQLTDDLIYIEKEILESITGDQEKREVVFLVYKAEHWKSLHSLWQEAVNDCEVVVTVMAIPYYERNFKGGLESELRLENRGYPKEVSLTPYEEYNFEVHHPDVVIYQCPYDEYSYGMSVHPFFYASNLRQYAERMVFVPPFVLREIADGDERAKYTMRWFLHTPGLVYADEIYVQSEQMKKIYAELLTELTGEKQSEWKDKIVAAGSPIWDWENSDKKEDESGKKVLLYYVSGSVLFEYGEAMIDKIQDFLSEAESYRDRISIIWQPDPYAKEILGERMPEILRACENLQKSMEQKSLGVINDKFSDEELIRLCDGIYGDGGTLMNACRINHKPVLFETPDIPVDFAKEKTEDDGKKKWNANVLVAIEGEWTLGNFIEAVLEYSYEPPMRDCGRNIWNSILQNQ